MQRTLALVVVIVLVEFLTLQFNYAFGERPRTTYPLTHKIMTEAEALIEDINAVGWKDTTLNFDEEKSLFENIDDVERRLIDSKAVTMDSKIIGKLRRLKNNFCTLYSLDQNQRAFQKRLGMNDTKTMELLSIFLINQQVETAIKIFIRNFEAQNMVTITNFYIKNDISQTGSSILKTINHLEFEFKKDRSPRSTMSSTVIMKIPSIMIFMPEDLVENICHREVLFYVKILPKLYKWGKCKPFAPKPYAVTKDYAFIIEDLAVRKYKHADRAGLLNLNQVKLSLDLLAKFHALTYKYLQVFGNDDLTMSLIRLFPLSELDGGGEIINKFYQIVERVLSPSLYAKVRKIEDNILADNLTKKREEVNSMNVIIHGDYRMSNFLFNDKGEIKLFDFQMSRETSPAVDLIYFFITSVPIEIFEKYENALKNFYLRKLNIMLSLLNSGRVYNLPELDEDITYYKYYYLRILSINRLHMFDSNDPDKEKEAYILSAPKWVKYLEKKGIFE